MHAQSSSTCHQDVSEKMGLALHSAMFTFDLHYYLLKHTILGLTISTSEAKVFQCSSEMNFERDFEGFYFPMVKSDQVF